MISGHFMSEESEIYWEWRKFLLNAAEQDVNERVNEFHSQHRADWHHLTTLFEAFGDPRYKEKDYAEAALDYECLVKLFMEWEDRCNAHLKHLLARYHSAEMSWLGQLKRNNERLDELTEEVLKRGFWTCWGNPPHAEVLVTAINPSHDPKRPAEPTPTGAWAHDSEWSKFFPSFHGCKGTHWAPILKLVEHRFRHNCASEMQAGYLDLFPLRASSQIYELEKLPRELKAALLRITQEEIERLKPQLIVHLNRSSWFYWGIKPENPWMGYDLERVTEYQGKGELFLIKGLLPSDKKILPLTATELKGTYLLLYQSLTPRGRRLREEKMLHEEDIDWIFDTIITKNAGTIHSKQVY